MNLPETEKDFQLVEKAISLTRVLDQSEMATIRLYKKSLLALDNFFSETPEAEPSQNTLAAFACLPDANRVEVIMDKIASHAEAYTSLDGGRWREDGYDWKKYEILDHFIYHFVYGQEDIEYVLQ